MDSGKGGKGSDALEPRELKDGTLLILARCPHQTLIWRMLKSGRGCKRQRRVVPLYLVISVRLAKRSHAKDYRACCEASNVPVAVSYLLGIFPS